MNDTQASLFPELDMNGGEPLALLPEIPSTQAPADVLEGSTGLMINVFVDSALGRCGFECITQEEFDAASQEIQDRILTKFVKEAGFGKWLSGLDDPRPPMCALIHRWLREPGSKFKCNGDLCGTCDMRKGCPNTGDNSKAVGSGTYIVVIPTHPSRLREKGGCKAMTLPCSGYPHYTYGEAVKVLNDYATKRPSLHPFAIGKTQRFDLDCIRFGITDPNRK